MIRAYLCGEQSDRDLHLGCLAGAYHASQKESTKLTPNLLMMGREVRLSVELVFGSHNSFDGHEITSYGDYRDRLRAKIQHAHEIARKHMSSVAKRSNEIFDTKIAFKRYNESDICGV